MDFKNVHVWTYRYLLKKINEVIEKYGVTVIYVDKTYTSLKRPVHDEDCRRRIK